MAFIEITPEPFEPEVELLDEEPAKIVLVFLHGMMSNSGWWREYEKFSYEGRFANFEIKFWPISYALTMPYDLVSGLGANDRIGKVSQRFEYISKPEEDIPINIICHSNGTYIFSLLSDELKKKFDWVFFSGSICHHDTDLELRCCSNVVNDCASRDVLPVIACAISPKRFGNTGVVGFNNRPIEDRFFRYGHSGAKSAKHFYDWILPTLCTGEIKRPQNSFEPKMWHLVLPRFFRWGFLVSLGVWCAYLVWHLASR